MSLVPLVVATSACGSDSETKEGNTKGVCALAGAGFVALADKLTHSSDFGDLGLILTSPAELACEQQVRQLIGDPAQPVSFPSASGGSSFTVTLDDLLTPATTPTTATVSSEFARLVDCVLAYDSEALVQLCRQGILDP
jgi:hypothetical protein